MKKRLSQLGDLLLTSARLSLAVRGTTKLDGSDWVPVDDWRENILIAGSGGTSEICATLPSAEPLLLALALVLRDGQRYND
jgi:hypothetical protein